MRLKSKLLVLVVLVLSGISYGADKVELPKVLMIGDSISLGYTSAVAELMADAGQKLSPENVMKKLELANSYFAKKYPNPNIVTGSSVMNFRDFPSNYWAGSVYYAGLMALHSVDPRTEYYKQAVDWGQSHQWKLNSYKVGRPRVHSRNANDHCAGQAYIDLYLIDPKPERIAAIRTLKVEGQ